MALNETDNNDNSSVFIRSLLGARRPVDSIIRPSRLNPYRAAQVQNFPGVSNEQVAVLNSPLSNLQKMMLEDVFISDPIIRRAITLFAKFLLGKRTKTTVDINKEFMTPEAQEQALATTFNESEINELKTMIDKINRQVKLRDKVEAGVIQALIGGRSALLIEKQGEMPVDLKVLNWGKLGRVFADKDTWQLLAVEYADRPKDKPILAEEMIYFTWQDYHVTPDSLYHGLSAIQPIADLSETIRLITSEDLKETARAAWASSGLIKFPPNTSQSKITDFLAEFSPGVWNATSQAVEVETHDLQPKIKEMSEFLQQGYRIMIEALGIPEFLMNSDEVPNRAVADLAMNAWRESDLNHARTWLQGILEPQWFDNLVSIRYPDIDINDMWIKAKLEFEDVTFETLKDKSEAVIPLYQAGLFPIEKVLKILDAEDVLEQVLAEQERRRKEEEAKAEALRLEREQQLAQFRQQQQQPRQEDDDDEELEEIRVRQRRASLELEQMKQQYAEQIRQASLMNKLKEQEYKEAIETLERQRRIGKLLNAKLAKYEGR